MVVHVGDVDVAARIRFDVSGAIELRGPSDRSERPAGRDLADAIVALIRDVEITLCVEAESGRVLQAHRRRRAALAVEAGNAGARDRREAAVRVDASHAAAV